MDRYYTVMLIPEKYKRIRSFRLPSIIFRSLSFFMVLLVILIGIFVYDYWNIIQRVYASKHLDLENKQLKEQIRLFQMKLNTLADDLERVHIFEKKT